MCPGVAVGAHEVLCWSMTTLRLPPEARLVTASLAEREPECAVAFEARVALPLPTPPICQQAATVLEVQPDSNDGLVTVVPATAGVVAPSCIPTTTKAARTGATSIRTRRLGREIRRT